jgi:hypothetical protein
MDDHRVHSAVSILSGDESPTNANQDAPVYECILQPFLGSSFGPLANSGRLSNGNILILMIIDAFSRWVEFYSAKTTTAVESASCIFKHFGRFGTPEVVHTDRGTAFHNKLVEELLGMSSTGQSLTTAYSSLQSVGPGKQGNMCG